MGKGSGLIAKDSLRQSENINLPIPLGGCLRLGLESSGLKKQGCQNPPDA
jgi:hypothetical protein